MKLFILPFLLLSSFSAYSNDFLLALKNYESFGGSIPVEVIEARAQAVSESFSDTSKRCYKKTGLWSSESEPYRAKQNLKINLYGNDINLVEAVTSMGMSAHHVSRKAPTHCEIKSKVTLLVQAKSIHDGKEYLLHGEILINPTNDEFYFQSGMSYDFLRNPEVSMTRMPRIPDHILEQVWKDLDSSNSRMQTNF